MDSPGPYCQSVGITFDLLQKKTPPQLPLKNGMVLELKQYADEHKLTILSFLHLLSLVDISFTAVSSPTAVIGKLNTLIDQKKRLVSKKKVKGVKNLKELLEKPFTASKTQPSLSISSVYKNDSAKTEQNDQSEQPDVVCKVASTAVQTETHNDISEKELNVLTYKVKVQERKLKELSKKVASKKDDFTTVSSRIGHYSVKNINKRDETARKNIHLFRNAQREIVGHKKKIGLLNVQNEKLKIENGQLKMKSDDSDLRDEINVLKEKSEVERDKKISLQKSISYLKTELNRCRGQLAVESCNCENVIVQELEQVEKLKLELAEKDRIVSELEDENSELRSTDLKTRNEQGSYTDEIRLCVMELAGLEVATEKMSLVIQVVAKHIFGKQLECKDLPNAATSQTIVDEGQYVAKYFIAEKLEQSSNWGLCRDGTTRHKQKIVDTAITLDTGDNISLGFTRVARETADTIQKVTEQQLKELSDTHVNPDYLCMTLQKLAFTMSDRASNEKRADQLLDEWRERMLSECGGNVNEVHHFHCMAHVLLGLHNYIMPEIKELEQTFQEESGPIGRDTLSFFNSWSKKESVIGRVVRTTSDTFGPAGDHLGVRDRWDAFCCANGIKSHIGNYRDNRFNALFQTSAEVFLHRSDFIKVLETVSKPNLKLKAVKSDLESKEVCALLQCLGLFYLKLTGPYWNLMTCSKVQYYELYKHVVEISNFLKMCETSPEHLLVMDKHWSSSDPLEISQVQHHTILAEELFVLKEDTREYLFRTIPVVARSMLKCIHKQLEDFFPGGKFYNVATCATRSTTFAPVTNLSCEHHFGDLDSSQRRRPRASFHHHSSIQLLKRNRSTMMKWIDGLDCEKKTSLLKCARKGGKQLRHQHRQHEQNVLQDIGLNMSEELNSKGKKRKKNTCKDGPKKKTKCVEQFEKIEFVEVNDYIAVAYQDSWYPGMVEKVDDNNGNALVKFMAPCKKSGYFQWPNREDRQVVDKQFILCKQFIPDCVCSGRQWYISEHLEIANVYSLFHSMFF